MTEKPPFQTWQEIERKINRGGLTGAEQADLWDCLFLTLPEIAELLAFVKTNAQASVSLEGEPVKSLWTGVKTGGNRQFNATTYRCETCGFLECRR